MYTVRDEGPGFDPASLPDPTDPANLDRPCGRGLLLMRTFMDNVIFNDKGNEVTLADCFQPALQVIAREIFDFQVRHEFPRRRERSRFPLPVPTPYSLLCIRFSTRASSNRPRLIRDLTVPWGTPRICAISS